MITQIIVQEKTLTITNPIHVSKTTTMIVPGKQ